MKLLFYLARIPSLCYNDEKSCSRRYKHGEFRSVCSLSKGRKTAAVVTAFDCLLSFILFTVGARLAWEPYLVGFFCGAFIGSYYTTNDVLIMMIGESSPTNLRSSTMSAQFIVTALGVVISYGVSLPLVTILGNTFMGVVCFGLLVPGFIIALFLLAKKTHETKGINMDTVTGCEWD